METGNKQDRNGREMNPYRYTLERDVRPDQRLTEALGAVEPSGTVCFVMLNPSTADETEDDPTIRKCIGFAQRWHFAKLTVGNLWPYRATSPKDLFNCDDPDPSAGYYDNGIAPGGGDNDDALWDLFEEADQVICAWGAHAPRMWRLGYFGPDIEYMLSQDFSPPAMCLGYTKSGQPRHPLMLPYSTEREPWVPDRRPVAPVPMNQSKIYREGNR